MATAEQLSTLGLRIPESRDGLPLTGRAFEYAERLHAGQRRRADGAPFIAHPAEVARLLYEAGAPDHVIAAGVLHDVLEKTDADADDLQACFGSSIAALVLAVTEDERIVGYTERKAALRQKAAESGREALMVFAADKVSKVRELRLESARARQRPALPSRERIRRLAHHRRCLTLLEECLPDSPLVRELRAELEHVAAGV